MKKYFVLIAVILGSFVLMIVCWNRQSDTSDVEERSRFHYTEKDVEIAATTADNYDLIDGPMTIVHMKKGTLEKNYVWSGSGVSSMEVDRADVTGDEVEDYSVRYLDASGTGTAIYFMSVINGTNLAVIEEFGVIGEMLNPEQLAAVNAHVNREKATADGVLDKWVDYDKASFERFKPELGVYDGAQGIILELTQWYDHGKGIRVKVFLQYDVRSKGFVVKDLVSWEQLL